MSRFQPVPSCSLVVPGNRLVMLFLNPPSSEGDSGNNLNVGGCPKPSCSREQVRP